jgi:hypothetical protein
VVVYVKAKPRKMPAGFPDNNSLDRGTVRNAEIYQWNLGVQHLFRGQFVIGIDYSASRSTHLPYSSFSGTANRNFLPSSIRNQLVTDLNPGHDVDNTDVSNFLNGLVANPFQPLFQGPDAIFNEPDSLYNDDEIPTINLLRPFFQFDGPFSGLMKLAASAAYIRSSCDFKSVPATTLVSKETTLFPRLRTILRRERTRSLHKA